MALKDRHSGVSWLQWPAPLVLREPAALQQARSELDATIRLHKFRQFLFFRQWEELRRYAHSKGIRLIGDVPIFVSSDSADVWANPDLFQLDERRQLRLVAGVPPDYFSRTGQLWGNPLYDWEALERTGYQWWIARLRATLEQVDRIRLDHFRGFEAYWEIPAGMPTAEVGRWVKGPGSKLFAALQAGIRGQGSGVRSQGSGDREGSSLTPDPRSLALPLIAEDLGVITPEVEALRDQWHLPGMRILQFAFGGATESRFLPHNYEPNTFVYTGTHDNDTTRGWYGFIPEPERDFVRRYLGRDGSDISWDMIRLAWGSVADYAVVPLQDILNLGPEARMNMPGRPSGNWSWRFLPEMVTPAVLDRLGALTELYSRQIQDAQL
jgi:4-alpha-glucanotransferase